MSGEVLELLTDRIDSTERELDSTKRMLEEERQNARKKDERIKAAIDSEIESIRSSGLDENEAREQIMRLEGLYSVFCSDNGDDSVGDRAMAL